MFYTTCGTIQSRLGEGNMEMMILFCACVLRLSKNFLLAWFPLFFFEVKAECAKSFGQPLTSSLSLRIFIDTNPKDSAPIPIMYCE